jgi:hypothetical protein
MDPTETVIEWSRLWYERARSTRAEVLNERIM